MTKTQTQTDTDIQTHTETDLIEGVQVVESTVDKNILRHLELLPQNFLAKPKIEVRNQPASHLIHSCSGDPPRPYRA